MRAAVLLAGIGLLPGTAVAQAPAAPEASLLRCAEGSSAACLTTAVTLDADLGRRLGAAGREGLAWRARFMGDTGLAPMARRGRTGAAASHRVLLLVDVSGSMRRVGIGTARIVVREFLRSLTDSLPPGSVRVAVAPFGSISVAERIDGAVFTTPDSAQGYVDALPVPDRENTGLYSAIELGVSRVAREARSPGAGGVAVLVVITDGDNDVRPGDDPGLLTGDEGLARAARAVDQAGAITSIVGIGDLNARALRSLAGRRGRSDLVEMDAFEIARPLGEVRNLLWSSWELVVPLSTARVALGRGYATLTPSLALGTELVPAGPTAWRPPVVALPAFAGTVPAELAVPGATGAATGFVLDRRVPLAAMIAVLLLLLWFVLPRVIWPPLAAAAPAATRATPPPAPAAKGGLRSDLKEAPPRRPTDITASRARRG